MIRNGQFDGSWKLSIDNVPRDPDRDFKDGGIEGINETDVYATVGVFGEIGVSITVPPTEDDHSYDQASSSSSGAPAARRDTKPHGYPQDTKPRPGYPQDTKPRPEYPQDTKPRPGYPRTLRLATGTLRTLSLDTRRLPLTPRILNQGILVPLAPLRLLRMLRTPSLDTASLPITPMTPSRGTDSHPTTPTRNPMKSKVGTKCD